MGRTPPSTCGWLDQSGSGFGGATGFHRPRPTPNGLSRCSPRVADPLCERYAVVQPARSPADRRWGSTAQPQRQIDQHRSSVVPGRSRLRGGFAVPSRYLHAIGRGGSSERGWNPVLPAPASNTVRFTVVRPIGPHDPGCPTVYGGKNPFVVSWSVDPQRARPTRMPVDAPAADRSRATIRQAEADRPGRRSGCSIPRPRPESAAGPLAPPHRVAWPGAQPTPMLIGLPAPRGWRVGRARSIPMRKAQHHQPTGVPNPPLPAPRGSHGR